MMPIILFPFQPLDNSLIPSILGIARGPDDKHSEANIHDLSLGSFNLYIR